MEAEEVSDRLKRVLVDADGGVNLLVACGLAVDLGEEFVEARLSGEPLLPVRPRVQDVV